MQRQITYHGKIHELKVWPPYFNMLINNIKYFEIRKDDRGFDQFDVLILKEWNPETKEYTGQIVVRQITCIVPGGQFGIEKGYVAMGLQKY